MRLVWSSIHHAAFEKACHTLDEASIEYLADRAKNTDWESEHYGDIVFSIWIIQEDEVERVKRLLETEDRKILFLRDTCAPIQKIIKKKPHCVITLFCIALSLFTFMINELEYLSSDSQVDSISSINKLLLFDYPHAIELEESLLASKEPNSATQEKEILELRKASFWGGASFSFLAYVTKIPFIPNPSISRQYFAEKISQGELWRIFTPIFLHATFIHLLFNMMWLYILGRQIEACIGSFRYVLFILITAAFSNTAQYVMSGYSFLGFSGVLFAMAAFIAKRQRLAPFEPYSLHENVYTFLKASVWILVGISTITFIGECYFKKMLFSLGFANTAHVAGLLSGYLIGKKGKKFFRREEV